MAYLIIGIVIMLGMHFFGMFAPAARGRIVAQIGDGPWKGIHSIVSLIGLGLMIYGWWLARGAPEGGFVYAPPDWGRHLSMLLVLIGFILIGASHGEGNIKLWVKQPMSIGIALWAIGHLVANGERADIWLFGSILLLAIVDVVVSTARGKVPHCQPRLRSDILAVVVGIVLYLVFLFGFHPYILGVPVVS
ncbi:MAG: NnrU family protein [Rhizobiales bacterium]|nr:NnrU family protein [Hyphomicrobiales bacterium]